MARRKRTPRISRAELKRMRNFEIGGSPVGRRFRGYTQPGGGFGTSRPGSRQTLDEFGELLGQLEKSRQRQASDQQRAEADQQRAKADQRQASDREKAKADQRQAFEAMLRARMGKS